MSLITTMNNHEPIKWGTDEKKINEIKHLDQDLNCDTLIKTKTI